MYTPHLHTNSINLVEGGKKRETNLLIDVFVCGGIPRMCNDWGRYISI